MTIDCTNFALIKYLSLDPLHYASFAIQHIETFRESNVKGSKCLYAICSLDNCLETNTLNRSSW